MDERVGAGHAQPGPGEQVREEALDRHLAAALNVNPSPEYLPRVRSRVAGEVMADGWRWPAGLVRRPGMAWRMAGAGVAAGVIVGVVMLAPWRGPEPPPQRAMTQPVPVVPPASSPGEVPVVAQPPAAAPREATPEVANARATRVVAPVIAEATAEAPPFKEVLVSADEVRAIEMIVAVVHGRAPVLPPDSRPAITESLEPAPIGIGNLEIEPLPQIARLEGVNP